MAAPLTSGCQHTRPEGTTTTMSGEQADGLSMINGQRILRMPELIGGFEKLQRRLQYPAQAMRDGVEGTVWLTVKVDDEGVVQDVFVDRSVAQSLDEEAKRVMYESRFMPAIVEGGIPQPMTIKLPIKFCRKRCR
ncbi:MAG: energy transducer TonB [Bacteroidota bacterium]